MVAALNVIYIRSEEAFLSRMEEIVQEAKAIAAECSS